MTRRAAWVVSAAVAAVAFGCQPAKELPSEEEVVKPADAGEKPVAVPAASDPKAKAYVEKAVKAFTAGKPEVLAKGKASRAVLKGKIALPGDNQTVEVPATRTMTAVWPDRFVAVNEGEIRGQMRTVRALLRGRELSMYEGGREQELGNRSELQKSVAADVLAQFWLALVLPLTDPKAIVFDSRPADVVSPQTGQSQAAHLMKLALPDFPPFLLVFDSKTDLLIGVEYIVIEQGVRRRKQWSAVEHKPGPDGQLLPTKTEMRHDGSLVERWEVEKWEFPAAIPDAEFGPPKQ